MTTNTTGNTNNEEKVKSGLSGKFIRHTCMILAILIVFSALIANAAVGKNVMPIDDAIKAAVFILLVGLPIDVSMWLKIILGFFHIRVANDRDNVKN